MLLTWHCSEFWNLQDWHYFASCNLTGLMSTNLLYMEMGMACLFCRGPSRACLADSRNGLDTSVVGRLGTVGVVRDCQLGREVLMDRLVERGGSL